MAEQTPVTPPKKKQRSPSYPGIGLEVAIERAQALYGQEQRNFAHIDTAIGHWGYRPKSGAGLVVVAALKKFGLVDEEGGGSTRKVRVSEDARRLILLDSDEHRNERVRLLKKLALTPTIHSELWKKYGAALPSDATLRYELITERGFTDLAVREFIPQFRATIAYAGLTASDNLVDNETADNARNQDPFEIPPVSQHGTGAAAPPPVQLGAQLSAAATVSGAITRVVNLPLPGGAWAALQVPYPMSEDDWEQMLDVLQVMKRGIVQDPKPKAEEQPAAEDTAKPV